MLLMKIDNPGVAVTIAEFLQMESRMHCLPADITKIDFEWCGYLLVTDDVPEHDPDTHVAIADAVLVERDGVWYQTYTVTEIPPPPAPAALTEQEYIVALEFIYDEKARERRYDNRLTCALRAGYPGPFQAEGIAFAVWMDSCNAKGYELIRQVEAGEIEQPTIEQMIAAMPSFDWETVQ